jgi:hypothetical protein
MNTDQKEPDDKITLRQAAQEWIDSHPKAMSLFHKFAADMVAARRRFGVKLIAERVRWECYIGSYDGEDFKITNHFVAYIARELVRVNPAVADWIECRRTRAADKPYRKPRKDPPVDPRDGE